MFRQFAISLGNGLIFGFVKVEQVEFVDGDDDVGTARSFRIALWRLVWGRRTGSLPEKSTRVASTKIMAASAVDAPVTILRVYCSCPGVSAMMNLRLGVAK